MREYLKAYAFGNATWPDLIAMLDRRTPEDLESWSRAWVQEAGRPTIATELTMKGDTIASLAFTQRDPIDARGLVWTQPLKVAIAHRSGIFETPVPLRAERAAVEIPPGGSTAPRYVLPNADGVAYGNFILDPGSREHLLANLPAIDDDLRRGVVTVTLWEEMLDGRVPAERMLATLMGALPAESDELTLQRMLGYTEQAYWRWIPAAGRARLAPEIETLLRSGLDTAKTSSVKSAWFNALRDVSTTAGTLAWLERIWQKTETVPGLVLAEPDFITLAQELAVRGVPKAEAILEQQIARTQNPDRKARMVFVRPSLSADPATRDAFFAQMKDPVNRRREAWVLEGIGYLHHPLRAGTSAKHVQPSLELLLEIQRTGDIFFPKRWMDATLSGHASAEVAGTVKAFLDSLPPDYPDRLRRIILSSADDLFRATGVR
jgi:aminopeptidase N